ncbi:MAG TPA: ATP-binding protein [Terriglobia bacterium]|nr:ATP-binding protein [Terriglobia bacterium]
MSLSLKAKLTALISCLVLGVVVATAALYWSLLIHHAFADVSNRGQDVAHQVYEQSRAVLANARLPAGMNPNDPAQLISFAQSALTADPSLLSSVESMTASFPGVEYVALTASDMKVILHNDPYQAGYPLPLAPPFSAVAKAGLWRQLKTVYGPQQIYEVVLPLKFGAAPLTVRVGVSTVLLGELVKPELNQALWVSVAAVLVSTLTAGLLSFLLLRPLESISLNVERLARGELPGPVRVSRADEWGILSSKLNLLGERIRGEKAAFVALKENLDQLLANLADGLMFFDQQDRLVLATPAVARFLGRPTERILRQTPAEIFDSEDALSRLLRGAFTQRKPLGGVTVESAAGSDTGQVAASVVFVEERGLPVASLVTLRDAETRAQLESQIDTAAKLAAIGRLTSGVAHEVRNPLNAMVLQIEILKTKLGAQDAQLSPHLEMLGSEVKRLDRVVRTFLDFTRPVALSRVETDLERLLDEVLRMAEPEANRQQVRLVHERNGAAAARVDRDLMKQVLLNLVLNGCQAMPAGGELRVSARERNRQVEIEVADQGVGIPPDARPKIFSLYYTTKPSGTGVGLAMSYRIVQLHDGSIDFSSEVGRGTTFRVTLPRSGAQAAPPAEDAHRRLAAPMRSTG